MNDEIQWPKGVRGAVERSTVGIASDIIREFEAKQNLAVTQKSSKATPLPSWATSSLWTKSGGRRS